MTTQKVNFEAGRQLWRNAKQAAMPAEEREKDRKSRKEDKKSRRDREDKPEKKSRREKEPREKEPKEEAKREAEKVEVKPEPEDEGARRGNGGRAAAPAKDEKIEVAGVKRDQPDDDDVDVDDYDEARLDEVLPEENGTPGPAVRCIFLAPHQGP